MDALLSGSSPQESPSILGGQELGFCGVCPPGPLIKPSDFSGHLASVFCILLLDLSRWFVLST